MKSDHQSINIEQLANKKSSLDKCNNCINESFKNLEKSVSLLSDSWKCKGGDEVIKNFNEHLKPKAKIRYNKQNDVIKLLTGIEQEYESTENANKDLSSRFK